MATYANSEITRQALIMAAGELFAEYGIDAVTTRDIAAKANESLGIIRYHFGSKEGLLEAVLDFAGEDWKDDPLGSLLEKHRYLLKSRNGQNTMIVELIKLLLSIVFSPVKPAWCPTLMFQIIQRDLEISRKFFATTAAPNLNAFMEVYHTASGDHDFERAYHWSISIMAPAVLTAVNPLSITRMHPKGISSDKFMSKLEASCIQNALASIQFLSQIKKLSKSKRKPTEK